MVAVTCATPFGRIFPNGYPYGRHRRFVEVTVGRPGIVTPEPIALPEHELLARVFRTLGDATRLRLLEILVERGEANQSELVDAVDAPQPRVSEHLGCLAWCGFVTSERDGRTVTYRVIDPRAERFIALAREFLTENAVAVGCCTTLDAES
jgi:DNA-binding transcriptional ArsR family regulator